MATGCLSSLAWADSAMVTNSANGHSYKRFDSVLTSQQAKSACANRGAHLATITSQQENDFVVTQFVQGVPEAFQGVWLGGTDEQLEGTWRWITGESWSFQNWNSGEPNDGGGAGGTGGEDYLIVSGSAGNLWNDAGGPGLGATQNLLSYLCEWERLYESLATLSDITGDAIPDYATVYREAGNIFLLISNGATGTPIKRTVIGAESTLSSVSLSAASGDISVLLSRSNGTAAIQVRDEVTLALTATITVR
jgi:hypothetical protein